MGKQNHARLTKAALKEEGHHRLDGRQSGDPEFLFSQGYEYNDDLKRTLNNRK